MTPFRASDEQLEREISAVEQIVRVRINRTARELRDLDKDLRELKRERARRGARATEHVVQEAVETPAA
ncbi:MAG: hypothetical protein ACLQD9_08380 [Thermoplasmata archaeon]